MTSMEQLAAYANAMAAAALPPTASGRGNSTHADDAAKTSRAGTDAEELAIVASGPSVPASPQEATSIDNSIDVKRAVGTIEDATSAAHYSSATK